VTSPPPADLRSEAARERRRVLAGLAVSQLVGWGTLFYPIAVLGRSIGAELALPKEAVYAGIGVMLLAGAAIAPRVGRRLDRNGPRAVMAAGSLLAVAALLVLAAARGPLAYAAGWTLVGFATPTALGTAAFAALAQVAGPDARRAITTLTFFSGLASTVFWPATTLLEAQLGWRGALVCFAVLNLLVAAPIHAFVLPSRARHRARRTETEEPALARGVLPPSARGVAFVLVALAFAAYGVVGWGLALHFIELFQSLGVAAGAAVAIASLNGLLQVAARGADLALGGRVSPLALGLVCVFGLPCAFATLFLGGASPATTAVFMLFYSVTNGLMTIVRATLPLWLFGREGYGARLGKLAAAQNLVFAAAPILFAALLDRAGPWSALAAGGAVALVAAVAMSALASVVRRALRGPGKP
jgi:predicted MFS family arabinose efflux permease